MTDPDPSETPPESSDPDTSSSTAEARGSNADDDRPDDSLPAPDVSDEDREGGRQEDEAYGGLAREDQRKHYKGLRQLRLRLLVARLANVRQDRRERKRYAGRIFWLLAAWLLLVLAIVFLVGLEWTAFSLHFTFSFLDTAYVLLPGGIAGGFLLLKWYRSPSDDQDADDASGDSIEAVISSIEQDQQVEDGPILRSLRFLFVSSLCVSPVLLAATLVSEWSIEITSFTLPPSVLNTLLATTTINVIGLFFVVARYLFSQNQYNQRVEDLQGQITDWLPSNPLEDPLST